MTALLLVAKEPVPGRAKTRLHPPLSLRQAARIAELSLAATIATANRAPFAERILAWEGSAPPPHTAGWRIVPQIDGPFDLRLGAALDACDGPTLLIGMDTPQLAMGDLAPVLDADAWRTPAWFGAATDGGFWALGLAEPDGDLVRGVPMSREDTGARQLERLRAAGLPTGMLRELTDIDTIDDAREVAAGMPRSALARELDAMLRDAGTDLVAGESAA